MADIYVGKCPLMSTSYDSLFRFRGISISSACAYSSAGQGTTLWPAPQLVQSVCAILQAADIYLLGLSLPAEQSLTRKIPHFTIMPCIRKTTTHCRQVVVLQLVLFNDSSPPESKKRWNLLRHTGPGAPTRMREGWSVSMSLSRGDASATPDA